MSLLNPDQTIPIFQNSIFLKFNLTMAKQKQFSTHFKTKKSVENINLAKVSMQRNITFTWQFYILE